MEEYSGVPVESASKAEVRVEPSLNLVEALLEGAKVVPVQDCVLVQQHLLNPSLFHLSFDLQFYDRCVYSGLQQLASTRVQFRHCQYQNYQDVEHCC